MWEVGLALALLVAFTRYVVRSNACLLLAGILFVNWGVNTYAAWAMEGREPDMDPWWVYLTFDYLSAVIALVGSVVICDKLHKSTIAIALSYAAECVVHAAYGFSDHGEWARYRHWWATFSISAAQAALVLFWGLHEMAVRRFGVGWRLSHYIPVLGSAKARR